MGGRALTEYPLLFRLTHAVSCVKFEAIVVAEGRVLMALEEGAWWCKGVEPGGLANFSEGPFSAFERFRASFRHVLDDLAEESESFEDFRTEVSMLFRTDAVEESRWDRALEKLRLGTEIDEPFQAMPRMGPRESSLKIEMLVNYADVPLTSEAESVALPLAA